MYSRFLGGIVPSLLTEIKKEFDMNYLQQGLLGSLMYLSAVRILRLVFNILLTLSIILTTKLFSTNILYKHFYFFI